MGASAPLDPTGRFRQGILLCLANAIADQQVEVVDLWFRERTATVVTADGAEAVVDGAGHRATSDALTERGFVRLPLRDLELDLDSSDHWPQLLYDLGTHIDLLERFDRGLKYDRIQRCGGHALVTVSRGEHAWEFRVSLDELPVGLPDTFHDWAHRGPQGTTTPIEL